MYGLLTWTRSFTYDNGAIVKNADGPVFADHPQPNLWILLASEAKSLSEQFDILQLAPWCNGTGEGYTPFCLRNFNSNWGTEAELHSAVAAIRKSGMKLSPDLVFRQMGGENGGPGVFKYTDYAGSTLASWFQYFGQPGETKPPFVDQDDVPDSSGNYPFGRVRSYQHSVPAGAVTADTISALANMVDLFGLTSGDIPRWDDGKGMYATAVLEIMRTQPHLGFSVEFFAGNPAELDWYVRTVMQSRVCVEDYASYWYFQGACNNYESRYLSQKGYVQWNSNASIGFVNNPDVATSWNWTSGGTISQQIAFNLLLAYAVSMFMPFRVFMVYAEDYFPASANYPTGRGYKPYLDNMIWFGKKFAVGQYQERYNNGKVFAYTRDGNGGEIGWSGGCLIVVNFDTDNEYEVGIQTVWEPGQQVHNYSYAGFDETYTVGPSGVLNMKVRSNYQSDGQSYYLIAAAGVS